jgi:hypothetical protein
MRASEWLFVTLAGAAVVSAVYHFPIVTGASIALLATWLIATSIRSRLLFNRRGWEAVPNGRDSILYREQSQDEPRQFELSGDFLTTGRLIYVPSAANWNDKVPAWAADRRDEILGRVQDAFRGRRYTFQSSDVV